MIITIVIFVRTIFPTRDLFYWYLVISELYSLQMFDITNPLMCYPQEATAYAAG